MKWLHLSQSLSYLALFSSHTPALGTPPHLYPSTSSPLPCALDHPLPPLSVVQSVLTELSPAGQRERKQLSTSLSEPWRNSSLTAGWLTALYHLILRRRNENTDISIRTNGLSVSSATDRCHEIVDAHSQSGSRGFRFEWPQRAVERGVERRCMLARYTGGQREDLTPAQQHNKMDSKHLHWPIKGIPCHIVPIITSTRETLNSNISINVLPPNDPALNCSMACWIQLI